MVKNQDDKRWGVVRGRLREQPPAGSGGDARASLRMHPDMRTALMFLAEADRRTLSQVLEFMILDHLRATFTNEFTDHGELVDRKRSLTFREGKDPRRR